MRHVFLRLIFHVCRVRRPRVAAGPPSFLLLQFRMPLGCCVHGTPVYAALKEAHPGCTVVVVTRGRGLAVLAHDPAIDHLVEAEEPGSGWRELLRAARSLRQRLQELGVRPTQVLLDASNRRGSLALWAVLLRLAPTAGFAKETALCDEALRYDPARSLIDNNLQLVGPGTKHREPAVYFTAGALKVAQELLQEASPWGRPVTAFVVQGSGDQPNSWIDERFAEVVRHAESMGHTCLFLGTETEAAAVEAVRALAGTAGKSLAGRTSVTELAALLCLCDMLVTVDTGTLHVGRAAGLPMLVLGPCWQPPLEWLPLGQPQVMVVRGEDTAGIPPDYRMQEISVDRVTAAFTVLDSRYPPSVTGRQDRVARLLSTVRP